MSKQLFVSCNLVRWEIIFFYLEKCNIQIYVHKFIQPNKSTRITKGVRKKNLDMSLSTETTFASDALWARDPGMQILIIPGMKIVSILHSFPLLGNDHLLPEEEKQDQNLWFMSTWRS